MNSATDSCRFFFCKNVLREKKTQKSMQSLRANVSEGRQITWTVEERHGRALVTDQLILSLVHLKHDSVQIPGALLPC